MKVLNVACGAEQTALRQRSERPPSGCSGAKFPQPSELPELLGAQRHPPTLQARTRLASVVARHVDRVEDDTQITAWARARGARLRSAWAPRARKRLKTRRETRSDDLSRWDREQTA